MTSTDVHLVPGEHADVHCVPQAQPDRAALEQVALEVPLLCRAVPESLGRHAQCTDLIVMSQPDPSVPNHRQQLAELEAVLLGSARPVLLIPYTHLEPMRVRRVLVAWDGSRECIRAMTDALPLLRRAEVVTVMHWRREADDTRPQQHLASLRQWLALQG